MKKIFLLLTVSLTHVACASISGPVATTTCPDTTHGPSDADISYRVDDKFSVTMKLKHKAFNNSEFKIKLIPKGGSSNDVVITTTGVSGTKPDGTNTAFGWLGGNGSYNSLAAQDHKIILCVPPGLPEHTTFKFDVDISKKDGTGVIGGIDPRVDVK